MESTTRDKKSSFPLSLTEAEKRHVEDRIAAHGFKDRNEYFLALMEMEEALALEPVHDVAARQPLLKLSPKGMLEVALHLKELGLVQTKITSPAEIAVAEAQAPYGKNYKSAAAKTPQKGDRHGAA